MQRIQFWRVFTSETGSNRKCIAVEWCHSMITNVNNNKINSTTFTDPDHSICQWIQVRIHYESESGFSQIEYGLTFSSCTAKGSRYCWRQYGVCWWCVSSWWVHDKTVTMPDRCRWPAAAAAAVADEREQCYRSITQRRWCREFSWSVLLMPSLRHYHLHRNSAYSVPFQLSE